MWKVEASDFVFTQARENKRGGLILFSLENPRGFISQLLRQEPFLGEELTECILFALSAVVIVYQIQILQSKIKKAFKRGRGREKGRGEIFCNPSGNSRAMFWMLSGT